MDENTPQGFVLTIRPHTTADGSIAYSMEAQSYGVPEEVTLTVIRNWLRLQDDLYYRNFSGKS